jgi:hypothetical protein
VSRNLCRVDCYYCGEIPVLEEAPRRISKKEAGVYFDEYEGMFVAKATCFTCEAKYLAWVSRPDGHGNFLHEQDAFLDLSFRSTFNDEPGRGDLPKHEVTWSRVADKKPFPLPDWARTPDDDAEGKG